MLAMGVLFDYFAAASDEEAGAVIDRLGGPGSQTVTAAQPQRKGGIFGRRRTQSSEPAFATDPSLVVYDTVSVKGIDPVVQLGKLEELLTGRAYDDVVADPRSGHAIAVKDEGERVVVTLTGSLTSALAETTDAALDQVARPWSETEEFWGEADPATLAVVLKDLAVLARNAEANGHQLYCWVCV
jgi:hypothetical protein